jgi:serine/threonine-protein kinase
MQATTETETAAASETGGQILHDTYRLERLIGEGGMGKVYEAAHLRLKRRFAVKVLSPVVATLPEAVARFRREGEVTSALGHPHIIDVVDSHITSDGQPYIVMELLDGESLGSRLARPPALALREAAEIVRQAASALHAAHGLGVVHRDLKPENVFLCRRSEGIFVKVLDFGISKVLGSQSMLTAASVIMGTPSYMAPEQAEGRIAEIDARTDIFALGAILYEMLAGRPPFLGESITAVLYQTVHQEPIPLRELQPLVPAAVERVVARALAKRPSERYGTALELAEDLARALAPRPVVAPPSPRLGLRARLGLGLGAALLLGLGAIALWPRPAPVPAVAAARVEAVAPSAPPPAPRVTPAPPPPAASARTPASQPVAATSQPASLPADPDAAEGAREATVEPGRPRGGSLRVIALHERSATWADVYLDRKKRGQTPLVARVAAGEHVIELRRAGYRTTRSTITIAPGHTTTVRLALERSR